MAEAGGTLVPPPTGKLMVLAARRGSAQEGGGVWEEGKHMGEGGAKEVGRRGEAERNTWG